MHSTRARSAARVWALVAALSALFAIAAGAISCKEPYSRPRFRGAGASQPHQGGTFRFAFDTDLRSLDPHIAYDAISGAALHLLYDTLVDYAPASTEIVPSLAERWEVSPDGREYTFHLRPGVRFHHGRALSAEDVRRSFERMLDPARVPCPGTSFYRLIEGFEDFQEHRAPHLRGIEVLDPLTVRFRLAQPDQTFLNVMAMPFSAPIPVEVADRLGRYGFSQNPVGTGPFKLERWEAGARLVFVRNQHYWRPGRPYLDRIILELSLSRYLQFMRFQRADLEYVHNTSLSTADYLWLINHAAWRPYTQTSPDISMYGVSMNTEMPPFNNRHLRRAVAFALDRDAACRSRNYRCRPLGGIYPPGLPGHDPHLPGAQTYDLEAARREMRLAGYPNGLPEEIPFWIQEGDAGMFWGQTIQADLARIGIRVRLRPASFSAFLENTERRGAVQLALAGWSQDFPDPANFVEILFHSRSIQAENSQNPAFYSNPTLDALLDRARVETNRERRIEMYRQAERIVVDDAPWAFQYYPVQTEAVQPYVRNYRTHPVWSYYVGDAWLDLPRQRFARREALVREAWSGLAALALPWRAQ